MHIALSAYYEIKARQTAPSRLPYRARRDAELETEIQCVYDENFRVHGAEGVLRELSRDTGEEVRCSLKQLMARLVPYGAVGDGKKYHTTIAATASVQPADLVKCQYDVFACHIIGWKVSRSMKAELVLDVLDQALRARRDSEGLVHYSHRVSKYLRIYSPNGWLRTTSNVLWEPRVYSYDNALAEFVIGLLIIEIIHLRGPW